MQEDLMGGITIKRDSRDPRSSLLLIHKELGVGTSPTRLPVLLLSIFELKAIGTRLELCSPGGAHC